MYPLPLTGFFEGKTCFYKMNTNFDGGHAIYFPMPIHYFGLKRHGNALTLNVDKSIMQKQIRG